MTIDWKNVFDAYATKKVTKTDKEKGAFVPTKDQCRVIAKAGIKPAIPRPATEFSITILNDTVKAIGASFYHSERLSDPTRTPEPRMGHAFISSWLEIGDTVLLGCINDELFALKVQGVLLVEEDIRGDIAKKAKPATIMARALRAKGKPKKKSVTRDDFVRDPYVVQGAIIRSGNICEMPGCGAPLFFKNDGTKYLEVHHVIPLAENGDDTLGNVAALCPHCHREHHVGRDRVKKRAILKAYIDGLL